MHARILTFAIFIAGLNFIFAEEYKSVSDKVRYAPIGEYSRADLQKILTEELEAFETTPMKVVFPEPTNGVKLYRVLYQTVIPEKNNQAYEWRSLTPARYYWGAADEAIAPYIATLPVKYQETIGGAEATAVFAGEQANHRGTFIFGVKDQKTWFDQLRE